MVTSTYLPIYLCHSSDSCDSCDSCDSSDSSDSSHISDSSDSSGGSKKKLHWFIFFYWKNNKTQIVAKV